MNIMITGAGGFVGRHLQKALENQHKLLLASREKNNQAHRYLDLTDQRSVKDFLWNAREEKIDVLIHGAGRLVHGDMSYGEQMEVFYDNIAMTNNTVEIIRRLGIKRLINFSSMAVYPNMDGIYSEKSEIKTSCNNECMYGLSKFCAENMFDYALKGFCGITHLRLAQIYGDGMRDDRLISIMRSSVLCRNEVEVLGNGERISNFISIEKVCEIVKIILAKTEISGVYNIGDKNRSYMEIAEGVVKKYGNKSTKIIKREDGLRTKFYLEVEKMNKLLLNEK